MSAIQLTPAQRREQRALAHHLDPVVLIGDQGLTPAVVKEVDHALNAHGLIKVRVFSDDRDARTRFYAELCDKLRAAPIQQIGKLFVLWRPMPEKERVADDDHKGAPRVVKVLKFSKSGNHRPQMKKLNVMGNERVTSGGIVKRAKRRITSVKKTQTD